MPIDSNVSTILIADDHPVIRKGLLTLLKSEWPLATIIEASDGNKVVELFNQYHPDVSLLDFRMPNSTGYESAIQILRSNASVKIILFTLYDSFPVITNFLSIGGRGFLTKNCDGNEIVKAVKAVYAGNYFFHSSHESEILRWMQQRTNTHLLSIKLTERELQVVLKLSKGLTNKEIANELKLSVRTVESYKEKAIEKTQVKNTAELIEYVFRNGIV
jgi:two-component system, NarL family, response regulator NreC